MYRTHFSNDESCINQPHHSDNDDDIPSNDKYHQEDQSTLLGQHPTSNTYRCQQTNRPYVPENDSSDESDLNADASSDQCDLETSSLSYENSYGDESNEGYDYSSEEQSMFLCKHKSKQLCKCRKTCGLYAPENDSSDESNSYSSDPISSLMQQNDENSSENSIHQRDESNCLCQHEIPEEACRCTQNSRMGETYANGTRIDSPRPSELSSDEFERKYIDSPERRHLDSKYLPNYPSEYPAGKYDESSQYDQSSETGDEFRTGTDKVKRRRQQVKQEMNESSSDDFTFNE